LLPKKQAAKSRSEAALKADELFWKTFHRGEYQNISNALEVLTPAYVQIRRNFQEAVKLDPSEARYRGFLAGHILAEGNLHKDEQLTRQGYFMLLDSIEAWPEFNLFTGGYVMSRLPPDSPRFREGLEWQWRTLDECIEEKIDRANPDYSRYMSKETKRAGSGPAGIRGMG
jgi:hypothetical protein